MINACMSSKKWIYSMSIILLKFSLLEVCNHLVNMQSQAQTSIAKKHKVVFEKFSRQLDEAASKAIDFTPFSGIRPTDKDQEKGHPLYTVTYIEKY